MANPTTRYQVPTPPPISWYAGVLPRALLRAKKDFFIYTADFLPLAASAVNAQTPTQIQADSAFLVICLNGKTTDTATPPVFVTTDVVAETIQINDAGAGRNLFSGATLFGNVVGTAANPFYWPYPKLIKAASTLNTILTALEATARNVRLAYVGFKIFGLRDEDYAAAYAAGL